MRMGKIATIIITKNGPIALRWRHQKHVSESDECSKAPNSTEDPFWGLPENSQIEMLHMHCGRPEQKLSVVKCFRTTLEA